MDRCTRLVRFEDSLKLYSPHLGTSYIGFAGAVGFSGDGR